MRAVHFARADKSLFPRASVADCYAKLATIAEKLQQRFARFMGEYFLERRYDIAQRGRVIMFTICGAKRKMSKLMSLVTTKFEG